MVDNITIMCSQRLSDWVMTLSLLANGDVAVLTCNNTLSIFRRRGCGFSTVMVEELESTGNL